jgi:hypothetical protein
MTINTEVKTMALKDLYKMTKADRYTADGREALIKAQEAETEDKVYQIGGISQKTGLQKTANGWVKPKNGKQPGVKKETPEEFIKNAKEKQQSKTEARLKEEQARPQKAIESARQNFEEYKKENPDWQNKSEEEIYRELGKKAREAESKPAAEKTDGFDYRSSMEKDPRSAASFKGAVSHSIPMNQTDRDELEGLSKFMSEEKATYQNALKNRAQALVDGHKGNGDWFPEKEKAIMKIAKAVGFDKELHKFIEEENRGYDLGYSEDAAPRQLTGDTRIRVRKA